MDEVRGNVRFENFYFQVGGKEWRKDSENGMNFTRGHSQKEDSDLF